MENAKNSESEKESPPLRIDPKCFRDALGTFFQPTKTDDPLLDFYTVYSKEGNEYDVDYVKKYDEDLNTTLIFAGLFSAVSSAFVIDIYSKLQPDPNDQSAALLRAILLTLNHSAIPNVTPAVPPVQEDPPNEIVITTSLLFASLLISLLAAFIAMLGKQWLNRYLRHAGGSMIERCGDRQRKCDGLQKWPFHLIVESLPVMLQVALLLLACGLCSYMGTINTSVAYTLATLTGFGVLFYVGVIIAGASSYDCPFQTPASALLRRLQAKVRPHLTPTVPIVTNALRTLGGTTRTLTLMVHSSLVSISRHFLTLMVHPSFVNISRHFLALLERIQLGILHIGFYLPWIELNIRRRFPHPPLPTTQVISRSHNPHGVITWFAQNELAMIQAKNANNVRCVSWVIRNITDPEVLDAAIRLAGIIWWFEEDIDTTPVYDLIVSTFESCFGSNRVLHPGLRNRAYYSGRAILWIRILAVCKSEESARMFPLPATRYTASPPDSDLGHLLHTLRNPHYLHTIHSCLHSFYKGHTHTHLQWFSNILLRLSWATHTKPMFSARTCEGQLKIIDVSDPLDTILDRLLVCCNLLGSPVGEDVLKIQDKSDRKAQVLSQVSGAILSALDTSGPRYEFILEVLSILTRLEDRSWKFAEEAYGWCAMIWKIRQQYTGWKTLLLLSLEVGFRHVDSLDRRDIPRPPRIEHHQELIDTVLKSNNDEAVADLVCASYMVDRSPQIILDICATYVIDHREATGCLSSSSRKIFSFCVGGWDFDVFETVGKERFIELLNRLQIVIEDMGALTACGILAWILLEIIQSPEGARHLAIQSWELLAEIATKGILGGAVYSLDVTPSLLEAQEWDKLKYWMAIVWTSWPLDTGNTGKDVEDAMTLLFRERPGAIQELTRWVERRWGDSNRHRKPFQQIFKRTRKLALLSPSPNESFRLSPPTRSQSPGGAKFWESLPLI